MLVLIMKFIIFTIFLFIIFIILYIAYLSLFITKTNTDEEFINDPSVVIYFKNSEFELGQPVEFYINSNTISCLADKQLDFQIKKPDGNFVVLTPPCSGVIGKTTGHVCINNKITNFIAACTDIMGSSPKTCTTIEKGHKGIWYQADFNLNKAQTTCEGELFNKPEDGVQVGLGEYTLILKSPTGASLEKTLKIIPQKFYAEPQTPLTIKEFLINLLASIIKLTSSIRVDLNITR
jgi:hypothetical protein